MATSYIRFTEEQKERANPIDLEYFLQRKGEQLIRSGRDRRLKSDHSITIRGNTWYDHAKEKGGYAMFGIVIEVNPLQPINAPSPMDVTLFRITL